MVETILMGKIDESFLREVQKWERLLGVTGRK